MTGQPATIEPFDAAALRTLETQVRGRIIKTTDDEYETARQVHDMLVDRTPAAIVQTADAADVIRAVNFARAHALPLAVRSGGHSLAGHSMVDGGLVIDLAPMKAVSIDPERRTAWVQAGATTADLAEAAAMHGLALSTGDAASVGLGGLTLGGGVGWLTRKHGLTIDNLLAVELVTADGRLLMASETEHPDLFWALRGGGGNFGIATAFEFQLQPVETVLGGALILPPTAEALRGVVDYASQAPDGLTTILMLMGAPPAPFIPAEQHGQLILMVLVCYTGDLAEGQAVVDELRAITPPIVDLVNPMPYPALFAFTADASQRQATIVRSGFFEAFSDAAIEAMVTHRQGPSGALNVVQIRPLGGAVARVPAEATAYAHRDKPYVVAVFSAWQNAAPVDQHRVWVEDLWAALEPEATGVYSNFLGSLDADRVGEAYPPATFARLTEIKRRYDPENLFRLNPNIPPAK